jgi:hypothetical protein
MKKVGFAVVVALTGFLWWREHAPAPTVVTASLPVKAPTRTIARQLPAALKSGTEAERGSLQGMARILYTFTRPDSRLKDLVSVLHDQDPVVAHDANPYTGEMAIVRTRRPLPGTRYFHAQFFSDEKSDSFVQHMSFEYKPGPEAMSDAVMAVQDAFHLGAPETERDGYVRWNLDEGRILWVKRLEMDELREDPFNAYTPADVGTIRVAIEAEIHGG